MAMRRTLLDSTLHLLEGSGAQRRSEAEPPHVQREGNRVWDALGAYPDEPVPADFAARYSADEQDLIIAHERQHAARHDPAANALLALLQCAFWFNPLMHLAASRFRFDQELACDAAVMARHGARLDSRLERRPDGVHLRRREGR